MIQLADHRFQWPCMDLILRDVERAHVAPSTRPTQGSLERLHLEALSSNLGTWSELQQLQGRDSSWIAISEFTCTCRWGWWRVTAAVVFENIKRLHQQTCVACNAGYWAVLSNSGKFTGGKQPEINQYYTIWQLWM